MWNLNGNKRKWRKLRLNIWKKRLQSELDAAVPAFSIDIPVSLHVSWGPFYNGAVILDRDLRKATILLQIPYDHYVTNDEMSVLEHYQLSLRDLPSFILHHEVFHLLDVLSVKNEAAVLNKVRVHHDQAKQTKAYRSLSFEQEADAFAYRCLREKKEKACYTYRKEIHA